MPINSKVAVREEIERIKKKNKKQQEEKQAPKSTKTTNSRQEGTETALERQDRERREQREQRQRIKTVDGRQAGTDTLLGSYNAAKYPTKQRTTVTPKQNQTAQARTKGFNDYLSELGNRAQQQASTTGSRNTIGGGTASAADVLSYGKGPRNIPNVRTGSGHAIDTSLNYGEPGIQKLPYYGSDGKLHMETLPERVATPAQDRENAYRRMFEDIRRGRMPAAETQPDYLSQLAASTDPRDQQMYQRAAAAGERAGQREPVMEDWTQIGRDRLNAMMRSVAASKRRNDQRAMENADAFLRGETDLGSFLNWSEEARDAKRAGNVQANNRAILQGMQEGRYDQGSDYGLMSAGGLEMARNRETTKRESYQQAVNHWTEQVEALQGQDQLRGLLRLYDNPDDRDVLDNEWTILGREGETQEHKDAAWGRLVNEVYNREIGGSGSGLGTPMDRARRLQEKIGQIMDLPAEEQRRIAYDSMNGDGAYQDRVSGMSAEERESFDAMIDDAIRGGGAELQEAQRMLDTAQSHLNSANVNLSSIEDQMRWNGEYQGVINQYGAMAAGGDTAYHAENDQWERNAHGGYWDGASSADRVYSLIGGNNFQGDENWLNMPERNALLMSPEERDIFISLYNAERFSEAEQFYQGLQTALNQRGHYYSDLEIRENARVMPIMSGAMTFLDTAMQPAEMVYSLLSGLKGDPYGENYFWTRHKQLTREQQADDLEQYAGRWASFLYKATMSAGDSALNATIGQWLGINPLWLFSGDSFQTSMMNNLEESRGNVGWSVWGAAVDTAIETATEIWSVEALMSDPTNFARYILKTAGAEASEEFVGAVFGPFIQQMMGRQNEWYARKDQILEAGGYWDNGNWVEVNSELDAAKVAAREWFHDIWSSTLSGAVSTGGGIFFGGVRNLENRQTQKQIGAQVRGYQPNATNRIDGGNEGINQLVEAARGMGENTQSRRTAEKINSLLQQGKQVSNRLIGQLAQNIANETNQEIGQIVHDTVQQNVVEELVRGGMEEEQANTIGGLVTQAVMEEDGLQSLKPGERRQLKNSEEGMAVLESYTNPEGPKSEQRQEMEQQIRDAAQEASERLSTVENVVSGGRVRSVDTASVGEQQATQEQIDAAEGEHTDSAREVIVDGEIGQIRRVVETKGGRGYVVDVNGQERTVSAAQLKASTYEAAAVIRHTEMNQGVFSTKATNELLGAVETGQIKNVGQFLAEATQLRISGVAGLAMPAVSMNSQLAQSIYSGAQQEHAESRQKNVKGKNTKGKGNGSATFNGVQYGTEAWNEELKKNNLGKQKQAQMNAIAEIARQSGIEVTFMTPEQIMETANSELGVHYTLDDARGLYGNQWRSEIQLNVDAMDPTEDGKDFKGRHNMLVTFGHEVTHWLMANSTEGYNQLERFVVNELQRQGVNVSRKLMEMMEFRNESGENEDLNDALSEIVADGCDQILANESVARHLQETNATLFGKIRQAVRNLVEKLREAAANMSLSGSQHGLAMLAAGNRLAKVWLGAYDEAISGEIIKQTAPGIYAMDHPQSRFSMSAPIEQRNDGLMAYHNTSVHNLLESLRQGGIAGPSVAIVRADRGHTEFGDVTVLFDRKHIDPFISDFAELYGDDSYTPTYMSASRAFPLNKKGARQVQHSFAKQTKIGGDYQEYKADIKEFVRQIEQEFARGVYAGEYHDALNVIAKNLTRSDVAGRLFERIEGWPANNVEEVREWLRKDILPKVIGEERVWDSGKQKYVKMNAEKILDSMYSGMSESFSMPAKIFHSFDQMKRDSYRLSGPGEHIGGTAYNRFRTKLEQTLGTESANGVKIDDVQSLAFNAALLYSIDRNPMNLEYYFSSGGMILTEDVFNNFVSLLDQVMNDKVDYFEAKLRAVMKARDMGAVILHDDGGAETQELIRELKKRKIDVVLTDGTDADRIAKANSLKHLRFSKAYHEVETKPSAEDVRERIADQSAREYLKMMARHHVSENRETQENILWKYRIQLTRQQQATLREHPQSILDLVDQEELERVSKKDMRLLQNLDREIARWQNRQVEVMGLDQNDLGLEYVKAWERFDYETMDNILMEKMLGTDGVIPYKSAVTYAPGRNQQVANLIKEKNPEAINIAAAQMAPLVAKNAVLVPMPPHTGIVTEETDTYVLAQRISELTGRPVVVALEGKERMRRKEAKDSNVTLEAEDLGFRVAEELPEGTVPYFIDNVIASGVTAKAAHDAFGRGISLAYAKSTRGSISGLKDAGNTFIDPKHQYLIPLDERFDMERNGRYKDTKYSRAQRDTEYLEAVRSGNVDEQQRMVDEAAEEAMQNSRVRGKDGKLLRMFHGTRAEFNEFDRDYIGSTGRFEGSGFNFTPYEGRAKSYGGNVYTGYLNIERPLSAESKTISVQKLAQIIREADPTGDNIISDYARETRDYGRDSFIMRESLTAARSVWEAADNDVDIYSSISAADPDAKSLIAVFEKMGYDGLIHYDDEGNIKTAIAFSSNQFKRADPVTYDNDQPINLSERFNLVKPDIRYSRAETTDPETGGEVIEDEDGETLAEILPGDVAVKFSRRTWTTDEKTRVKKQLLKTGKFTEEQIDGFIKNANSIAKIIADNTVELDFEASDEESFLKNNDEYIYTLDASTLCAKRLLYQGTFNEVQKLLPNTALRPGDLIDLVNMMHEMGYQTPCAICYVESRRRNLGKFTQEWLDKYKGPYKPKLSELTTTDGLARLKVEHRDVYDAFIKAMNKKGTNNPKVVQLRTDYNAGEIINKITKGQIEKLKSIGGLRINSFCDFEVPHMLDLMQAVMDMSSVGLTSQAYTKVPEFAWVFGGTGIKINLSLIGQGNGLDADGNLIFSSTEGMDFGEAMRLRNAYSKNVGTILVGINDEHIIAAMGDSRIDFIIPFHQSGWSNEEIEKTAMLNGYNDYTFWQNERMITGRQEVTVNKNSRETAEKWLSEQKRWMTGYKIDENPKNGKLTITAWGYKSESFKSEKDRLDAENKKKGIKKTVRKRANYNPVGKGGYWKFELSGTQNAETYLRKCAKEGRLPKFWQFLEDNGDGSFSLPQGNDKRSTAIREGYWKTLTDFKMYDNAGNGSAQEAVRPEFNMEKATEILNKYAENNRGVSPKELPIAWDVVRRYVEEYKKKNPKERYSRKMDSSQMDVNAWMMGLTDSQLMTEDERSLMHAYKDLRMKISVNLRRIMDYETKLKSLMSRENLTAAERDDIRALKNKIELAEARQDKLEDQLYDVTSSAGYAGIMHRQSTIMTEMLEGKTQEQIEDSVAAMVRNVKETRKILEREKKEIDRIAETAAVRKLQNQLNKTSARQAADMLAAEYNSAMSKTELKSRITEIALKHLSGEDITEDCRMLADDLLNDTRALENETMDLLRGLTITIGPGQNEELKANDSNINKLKSRLKGTGIRLKLGDTSTLDTNQEELRQMIPGMPDLGYEKDQLENFVRWVEGVRDGAKQAGRMEADDGNALALTMALSMQVAAELEGNEEARTQLQQLMDGIRKPGGRMGEMSDKLEDAIRRMGEIELTGRKAEGWTKALGGDLENAIQYYNRVAKMAAVEARAKMKELVIDQLRSEHARAMVEQEQKFKEKIKKDRRARELHADNESLRNQINTASKRISRLLTAETDQRNIPEQAKPLARVLLEMIVRHDTSDRRKITYITPKDAESVFRTLQALDATDGKVNLANLEEEMDWLCLGEGENRDTAARDAVIEDLMKIESGMRMYDISEGHGNSTLMDRKLALQQIEEGVSEILNVIRHTQQVEIAGRRMLAQDIANEVVDDMRSSRFKGEYIGKPGRAIGKFKDMVVLGNTTPEYYFKNLKNAALSWIHSGIHEAENRNGLLIAEAKEKLARIAEETGYRKWDTGKILHLQLDSGETVDITLGELMSLWATWKREMMNQATLMNGENQSFHLTQGGFAVEQKEGAGFQRRVTQNKAHRVTEHDMQLVEAMLTTEQQEYVDRIVEFMSTDLSAIGNEASMKMFGIKKYKENYYFPFKRWEGVGNRSSEIPGGKIEKGYGFSKRRINNASNALMIRDFTQTVVDHAVEMINYATMKPAITNVDRVMNQQHTDQTGAKRNVWASFSEAYGHDAEQYLMTFLNDLNGGVREDPRKSVKETLLGIFKKNAVAGSLSVALQQPLSYIRAAVMVHPKYLAAAMNPATWKGSAAEMERWSGVAVIKDMGRFDMNFGQTAKDYITPEGNIRKGSAIAKKISDVSTVLPELMDKMTWTRMWTAIKLEQKAQHPEMDHSSREFLGTVAKRFNDVMRQTQVYDSIMVKSGNMRSKKYTMKALTAFMAEPTLTLNVLADAALNVKEKGGKDRLVRALGTFIASAAFQAAVKGFMSAGRTPDDKKTDAENFMYRFISNLTGEINPLALIPGYNDLIEILQNGKINDDAMGVVGKVTSIIKKAGTVVEKLASGEGNVTYRDLEDTIAQTVQLLTDVPAKNIMRDFRAILTWVPGGAEFLLGAPAFANRETSADVIRWQSMDLAMTNDLIGLVNKWLGEAGYKTDTNSYFSRIYRAKKAGNTPDAESMSSYLLNTKIGGEKPEKTLAGGIRKAALADEDATAEETVEFLQAEGYEAGDYIQEHFQSGELSREQMETMLQAEYPDKTPEEIWWMADRTAWKKETGESVGNSQYYRLKGALADGKSEPIQGAVSGMIEHGMTGKQIKTWIGTNYKAEYLAMRNGSAEKVRMRQALTVALKACGLTTAEAEDVIDGWKQK